MSLLNPQRARLAALARRARARTLAPRQGVDFSSNDYLGLSRDPVIARAVSDAIASGVPVGSGGSRLLRGNAPEHEALEAKSAAFFGSEGALFLANGFAANVGLICALPMADDLLVVDELIHASIHDGLRHARIRHVLVRHNDAQSFEDAIVRWRTEGGTGRAWIVAETLYSMDGDCAPVGDFAQIAQRHDAMLLLDEAHATGVFGADGRGLAAQMQGQENLITLHTCGKALGVEGALVCGAQTAIDMLVNRARPFIFSTAPSPLMAVAVGAALDRIAGAGGDALRQHLMHMRAAAQRAICAPLDLPPPQSQIVPVILGEDRRTMDAAAQLQRAGFDVRGIRPPTVPAGTSRLRVSLTLNATPDDVAHLGALIVPLAGRQAA